MAEEEKKRRKRSQMMPKRLAVQRTLWQNDINALVY